MGTFLPRDAMLATYTLSRVSVCLSVTNRCSTETAERRITQTTPRDSSGTLVFFVAEDLGKTQTGSPPTDGVSPAKCRRVG